jgi:hypothetical protein
MPKCGPKILLYFSFAVLILMMVLNFSTPFRGEHWSLLLTFLRSEGLIQKFHNISEFACFGVTRFQPLAFFPLILAYLAFGLQFWGHILCAIVLHLVYTYFFLRIFHLGEEKFSRPLGARSLFITYPFEAALFLVLFFGADVLTWNFYLYLELACVFAFGATAYFWEPPENSQKYVPYAVIAIAAFFYEPMLMWIPGLLLFGAKGIKERLWGAGVLALTLFAMYVRYSSLPIVSLVPAYQKFVFALVKFFSALSVYFSNLLFPTSAVAGNIYEIAIPFWFSIWGLPVGIGVVIWLGLYFSRKKRLSLFLLLTLTLAFLFIAWPRTENSLYLLKQFRYFYFMSGLLLPLFLWKLKIALRKIRYGYPLFLTYLILIHGVRSVEHALRVRHSMQPLQEFIEIEKAKGQGDDTTVLAVAHALRTRSVPVSPENFRIIYNANSCLAEWESKL